MSITVGDQIGDYEIIGTLGVGGMGQVFQVRHTISHRIEAMKILAPGLAVTDEIVARFLREIRLLASLHHPNVTQLHTAFRHNGELIMIMEFVQGLTLGEKLNFSAPITLERGLGYIKQVLSGLAYAHEQGVIHRDVKPSNIMITRDDHVKLLDFGLAFPTLGPEFTRTGMVLGSLQYMPPEQVLSKQLDARSDIYSVGVTLYQLLTGILPFEGASDYDIASGHLKSVPVDPSTINRDIPVPLSKIVLKSLAKSPGDRFQTAKKFLEAFDFLRSDDTATLAISTLPTTLTSQAPIRHTPESAEGAPASGWPQKKAIDSSILDSVSRDLAHHVGPIAKVIVSRAAKQATTLDDLFARVAAEISTERQRQDFLATRIKHSISK